MEFRGEGKCTRVCESFIKVVRLLERVIKSCAGGEGGNSTAQQHAAGSVVTKPASCLEVRKKNDDDDGVNDDYNDDDDDNSGDNDDDVDAEHIRGAGDEDMYVWMQLHMRTIVLIIGINVNLLLQI